MEQHSAASNCPERRCAQRAPQRLPVEIRIGDGQAQGMGEPQPYRTPFICRTELPRQSAFQNLCTAQFIQSAQLSQES